ncbi:serine/threonine-protein kinase [Rubripirellula tenax]|uniref:serine/threonine-protein kinase n=1 Tax=Rubripirellula tenax TaxID=2528015 RepID=UPI0016456A63|nr:serine/threonine-protein kinase [Rubripirellula tenax]
MNDREADEKFVGTAVDRSLVSQDGATQITARLAVGDGPAQRIALEGGWMSPTAIEITEAFMSPEDLAPGYKLLDVIGQGALGVVYRAHQERLRRDVAVKAILQARSTQSGVLQRFQKEATAIGRMQHPNIVSAFDSGTHRGRVYLVMEWVRGGDLRSRIERGRLPLAHALSIVKQAAMGLAYAASHDIIHRDIKPANLMLADAPAGYDLPPGAPLVKIADFGLARFNDPGGIEDDQLTVTGATLGTPMYCAPEQLTGDPVDHRADIYALGATLFTMLSGVPPYDSVRIHSLVLAKVTGEPPRWEQFPDTVPTSVRELIVDMIQPDPSKRIADYATLIRRIDAQVHAPESSVAKSGTSIVPSRLHRRTVITALVAGIVSIVGVGGLLISKKNSDVKPPRSIETLWSQPLFDGQSLAGWTNHQSVWSVRADAEGSRVLAGKGLISHPISELPSELSGPAVGRGVRVRVDTSTAGAAEVQLAFEAESPNETIQWCVRLTRGEAQLGRRAGIDGEWVKHAGHAADQSPDSESPVWQDVQWSQFGQRWFAYHDGKLLGSFDVVAESTPVLRLAAEGGEAFFSDISVFGLESQST